MSEQRDRRDKAVKAKQKREDEKVMASFSQACTYL